MSFDNLNLSKPIIQALSEAGYEKPSPIQAQTIPLLLEGKNVLGQAQTGTGKTAAFALPTLSKINAKQSHTQVLVLTPTRELAIQVAAAFKKYGAHIPSLHVLAIYGGQDYRVQLRALQKGVHVVVGTPGRVMDHMRRKTLDLTSLNTMVLDEADEMLRMGFIEDVEWVLEHTPESCQMALFSATMPKEIRQIAERYLKTPEKITIKEKTATVATINQRYLMIKGAHKLDALTRILEAETFDGVIVFVRTKTATLEVAEALTARGYACAALNGDIQQTNRERIISQLKKGVLDIIIATDVAARGLDVERISHVVNYDIPQDNESYIHRIGRTGRAGRSGEAILFVSPRERGLLYGIERATKQPITQVEMPSADLINKKRIDNFKQQITDTLAENDLDAFLNIVKDYKTEHEVSELSLCAALVKLIHKQSPLFVKKEPTATKSKNYEREDSPRSRRFEREESPRSRRFEREESPRSRRFEKEDSPRSRRFEREESPGHGRKREARSFDKPCDEEMKRYRIEVGHMHGVRPGNIVGAIANEISLDSHDIGHICISDQHSTVDLPKDLPKASLRILEKVWVAGQQLQISAEGDKENFREKAKTSAPAPVRERNKEKTREIYKNPKAKQTYAPKDKKKRKVALID